MATSPFAFPLGVPIFRWFDQNGAPAASYQLQTYAAGSATPLATYPTYADAIAGTNPNTNPVVLDANGAAQVWVQAAFYKLVMMLPVAAGGADVGVGGCHDQRRCHAGRDGHRHRNCPYEDSPHRSLLGW